MDRPPLAHPTDPSVWEAGVPHETFAWLRANEPVSFWDDLEGRRGYWLVARHDDLRAVSHDTATFSSRSGAVSLDDLDPEQLDARRTMLEEDPPRHTALRALVDEAFLPRAVRAYADAIEALTDPVLDAAFARDRFDFVEAVAKEVPIRVLCRMLGVPERHTDDLVDWGNRMLSRLGPRLRGPGAGRARSLGAPAAPLRAPGRAPGLRARRRARGRTPRPAHRRRGVEDRDRRGRRGAAVPAGDPHDVRPAGDRGQRDHAAHTVARARWRCSTTPTSSRACGTIRRFRIAPPRR